MAQFLPTPYPRASSPPGPIATDTASLPTPRNPSSCDHSSAYTQRQGVPGLSIASMYSKSPSIDPEYNSTTNDMYTHTHTHSLRPSSAGSLTHSIATLHSPGPSGVSPSGHPPEPQQMTAGAEAKAREARMERNTSVADGRLRAVNMTEGVDADPVHPPTAWIGPPPAYSPEPQ